MLHFQLWLPQKHLSFYQNQFVLKTILLDTKQSKYPVSTNSDVFSHDYVCLDFVCVSHPQSSLISFFFGFYRLMFVSQNCQ